MMQEIANVVDQHWGFLLQILVIVSIPLMLAQIKCVDIVQGLRRDEHGVWGQLNRLTLFLKLMALCWMVIYGYTNGWQPWPPIVALVAVNGLNCLAAIFILRNDIERLQRLDSISPGAAARQR